MNLTVALSEEHIEAIARRAAEIVSARLETLDTGDRSPYMTVAEAAAHLRWTLVVRAQIDAHLQVESPSAVAPTLPQMPLSRPSSEVGR